MKKDKRLRDYKSQSAAARGKWGTSTKNVRKLKKQHRKKLRLANKEIDLEIS
jgi:hypothetical protein